MAKATDNKKPCADCADIRKVANLQSSSAKDAEVKKVDSDWNKPPHQGFPGNTAVNR